MEDNKIIDLLNARDENAIAELSAKYGTACRRIAKNILKNELDAEECVNDTFLAVWNNIPPEKPNPLKTYIFRIVRNISIAKYHSNTSVKRNSRYDIAIDELEECLIDADYYEEELAEIKTIRLEYFTEWSTLGYDPGFTGEKKERFTELFRSILEATLFVCDEDGVIRKVHSVPCAIPRGDIEIDENGNIVLTVYRIDEAEPPPRGINIRCIFAVLTEFNLVFDSDGKLIKTNEIKTHPKQQFVY